MMTDRELMQMSLNALERVKDMAWSEDTQAGRALVDSLRARLAQPEPEQEQKQRDMPCVEDDGCPTEKAVLQRFWRKHQQLEPEPVAWRFDQAKYRENDLRGRQFAFNVFSQTKPYMDEMVRNVTPLYIAPPQREWVGLTDEEIRQARDIVDGEYKMPNAWARAIETKLKEKNAND